MKVRELVRQVEQDGWYKIGQEGSHRQFKHPIKRGKVTISGNMGKDVPAGTLNAVLKQAGLK